MRATRAVGGFLGRAWEGGVNLLSAYPPIYDDVVVFYSVFPCALGTRWHPMGVTRQVCVVQVLIWMVVGIFHVCTVRKERCCSILAGMSQIIGKSKHRVIRNMIAVLALLSSRPPNLCYGL